MGYFLMNIRVQTIQQLIRELIGKPKTINNTIIKQSVMFFMITCDIKVSVERNVDVIITKNLIMGVREVCR